MQPTVYFSRYMILGSFGMILVL